MRRLIPLVIAVASFVIACDSLTYVDINFATYNASPDRIQLIVLGNKVGQPIDPQRTGTEVVPVPVPTTQGGQITNPNSQIVAPSVTFYDETLNKLSDPVQCSMNARGVVSVTYKVTFSPYDRSLFYASIWCGTSSYNIVPLRDAPPLRE